MSSNDGTPEFKTRDPDFEARVRDSFTRQNFMMTIGARITDLAPGRCEITIPHGDHITQQQGFIHGGVVGTAADNAAGYAAYTLMAAKDSILTVEYKLNLMAPAEGECIIARAEVLRPGRTLTIVRTDVHAVHEGTESLVATAMVTLIRMPGMSDHPTG